MNRHPLSTYTLLAGCMLATSAAIITGIYAETNGNPCEGCSYRESGCRLYKWMQKNPVSQAKEVKVVPIIKTNKQLAAEYGISARQVAKRRIPGTDNLTPLPEVEAEVSGTAEVAAES